MAIKDPTGDITPSSEGEEGKKVCPLSPVLCRAMSEAMANVVRKKKKKEKKMHTFGKGEIKPSIISAQKIPQA